MTSENFTWKHKLALVLIVPLFTLGILEGLVRLLNIERMLTPASQLVSLEMPAWMLKDENQIIRSVSRKEKRGDIDWFDMFEEGDGFRVRLIPGVRREVTNSFSLIDYDRSQKYLVQANSLGFRGPEITPKKDENTFRIIIFGDSSSFGWGVDQKDTFFYRLKDKLQALRPDKKIEIGNFAIPGDSSEYGKLIVEKYLPQFEADFVIYGFGANDAKATYVKHSEQVERFKRSGGMQKIRHYASHSALYRSLEALIKPKAKTNKKSRKKVNAVNIKEFLFNLSHIGKMAEEKGAKVMLLSICTPGNYANAVRLLAEKEKWLYFNGQVYLLQLLPKIKEKEVYPEIVSEMEKNYGSDLRANETLYVTSDACHPNKLGNALIADELTAIISRRL